MTARSLRFTGLAMLALLVTACYAAAPPSQQPSASSTGEPPASTAKPPAKPAWPDNGIAQRRFPGAFNMFVENDHGHWHAWVMSGLGANDAKALDFFSGKVMKVTAQLDEDTQQQDFSFTDAAGNDHFPRGTEYEVHSYRPPGLPYGITQSAQAYATGTLDLPATPCTALIEFDGGGMDVGKPPKWSKVLVDRSKPDPVACPQGAYGSAINSTLDLGDGTFLISMGCWVFRLHGSDLMPVGAAPGLRVIDAAVVAKAIAAAKQQPVANQVGYFAKTLHLDIDDANTCN